MVTYMNFYILRYLRLPGASSTFIFLRGCMKLSLLSLLVAGLLLVCLSGCDSNTAASSRPELKEPPAQDASRGGASAQAESAPAGELTREMLIHHRFVLKRVDGVDFPAQERMPVLEFGEGLHVAGSVCNRFVGAGNLQGNVLSVGKMAFTKMLCVDENLNRLEGEVGKMLEKGATLTLKDKILTLSGEGRTLEYELNDLR